MGTIASFKRGLMMDMASRRFGHILLCVAACFSFFTTGACSETVFQVGRFDESSAEFSPINDPDTGQRRINYLDPVQDPVFVVGKSDPARHWYSYQPGTANGAAGNREHPFAIEFELKNSTSSGDFHLTLSLLAYSTRLPVMRVEVNGAVGWLHQRPRLAYSGGDQAVFFLPHYAVSSLECDIPPTLFRSGTNRIVLTPVDDPGDRDDVRPSGYPWPGNSAVIYDAIRLERTSPKSRQQEVRVVDARATVFFFREAGKLSQELEVTLGSVGGLEASRVALVLPKVRVEQTLNGSRAFGEHRLLFRVPEFSEPCEGEVEIRSDSATRKFPVRFEPRRKWEMLVVPNEHLDIGYTDHDSKVAELQSRTIDTALDILGHNRDFRFSLDGYWVAEQFLRGRNPSKIEEFRRAVRKGQIGIPAVYGSVFTGFAGLENLIRGLYPSKRLLGGLGLPLEFALVTDVPSCSWSFASVLAAADIPYLVVGSDAYRGPFLLQNRFNETSPHRWEGPDGGSVITWYSRHYHQVASLFGMPPVIAQGRESIPRFLQAYEHPGYPSDTLMLYGTQVENTDLDPAQARLVQEWNSRFAYPRLRFATFGEAMKIISAKSKSALPVHRGDGGPYWEDGLGANAKTTRLARENMQRVLSAEKFSTWATMMNSAYRPDRVAIEGIWRNILLTDEHTWHADQSVREPRSEQTVKQGDIKDSRSVRARQDLEHLMGRSLSALAQTIRAPVGSLLVFNSLSWARGGIIEIDLARGKIIKDAATGARLGHQVLDQGNNIQRVRVRVPEVPALGYRLLEIEPGNPEVQAAEKQGGGREVILENRFYQVVLEAHTGRIRSILDKEVARDLIQGAPDGNPFNRYLYVTGGDHLPNRLVQYSSVSPLPELQIHPATGGKLVSVERTGFGSIARIESSALNTPEIQTDILLYNDFKRIDFVNRVRKTEVLTKEGVYFDFPLNLRNPTFRYATQNGYVDPSRDLLPGAGREWFTTQGWISASDPSLCVTMVPIDAPLFTLGDIARGTWPTNWIPHSPRVLSYVMNNYTPEGYQAGQGGEIVFRHAMTSGHHFEAAQAFRFAAEAMTPLEINEISRGDKAAGDRGTHLEPLLPGISVEPESVVLVNWKLAEDGDGTILRFLETAGMRGSARVHFGLWRPGSAWICNVVEDNRSALQVGEAGVVFDTKPFGINTLRMRIR